LRQPVDARPASGRQASSRSNLDPIAALKGLTAIDPNRQSTAPGATRTRLSLPLGLL